MSSNPMNVINYNRGQLPQREKFKNVLGGSSRNLKTEYNLPKASTKQLNIIGKRLKEEYKLRMLKVVVCTIVLFVFLLMGLTYVTDVLFN